MDTYLNSTMRVVNMPQKTFSREHGDKMFWLGRYAERVFTSLKTLEQLYDEALDKPKCYVEYLNAFGLSDNYENAHEFFRSFVFDENNVSSVRCSLRRAYDNGIVLREEISTEALSFLQLAMDKLDEAAGNCGQSLRLRIIPVVDTLYSFWGCVNDHVFEPETKNIILCGKSLERLDLYFRLKYPYQQISTEFERLCRHLGQVPKNSPYRYSTKYLCALVEITADEKTCRASSAQAITSLGKLFSK